MDYVLSLLGDAQKIQSVILIVVCFNIMLTAVKAVLDKIKDKSESDWDNKAADSVAKVLKILAKVLDWAGANKEHK